jgi:hypothetical protein
MTVAKWRKRETAADLPTGHQINRPVHRGGGDYRRFPAAYAAAARRLPLRAAADHPHLTRSYLHRCLQRHGISRLPGVEGSKPSRKWFKAYPIGYFHIDTLRSRPPKASSTSTSPSIAPASSPSVQLVKKTGRTSASAFLEALIAAVPYKIHTVLTDNGIQFTFPPRYADGPTARYATCMFDMRCQEDGIEYRLTKIKHLWTPGRAHELHDQGSDRPTLPSRHDQLEAHLADFINAYNYARRLKTLKGLMITNTSANAGLHSRSDFKLNPLQKMP